MIRFRTLAAVVMLLTFAVVTLGAYVRLKDAGLGCPDWPGCYGKLVGVPTEDEAAATHPEAPLDSVKAWIEVVHRYAAAMLGLLSLALAVIAVKGRREFGRRHVAVSLVMVAVVIVQGLLGMLTVTERLMPAVVTAHLLGGMLFLALAVSLVASDRGEFVVPPSRMLKALAAIALAAVFAQVALGGWVSTNYAGLSCPDFPACHGSLVPDGMSGEGFEMARQLGRTASGEPLPQNAMVAIHWAHRLGALLALLAVGAYAACVIRESSRPGAGVGLLVILGTQILVGIGNVVWQLPLFLAWLHNALAALLVVNMAALGTKILFYRRKHA